MIKQRRVLVTGSSRGIGRAIALRLARDGFCVTVHCRQGRAQADAVLAEIVAAGGAADVLQFDVGQREASREALARAVEENGAYYGIVCNAGITRDNTFPALSGEDWDEVMNTSLDGFFNVVQPLTMPMVRMKQGGRVITLASVSGITGNRGQVNYSAAKAGLIGASKALAVELASRRITVNCIAPGLIETEMTHGLPLEEALKVIPMNRVGRVDEVAAAVSFLMSDEASYITRQVLGVNGGII
jgi:3-oxoacyl-[acyl-carrier protein] reductase